MEVPAVQTYPAGQGPTGAVNAVLLQYDPAVHAAHALLIVLPVLPVKVPRPHGVGTADPATQKWPAGQRLPVTPSRGDAVTARRVQ